MATTTRSARSVAPFSSSIAAGPAMGNGAHAAVLVDDCAGGLRRRREAAGERGRVNRELPVEADRGGDVEGQAGVPGELDLQPGRRPPR